ncbi:related to Cell wall protein YJL171C [Hanseniaspora guilliermondii]|uniref:glucan endo-1,3-beta-D-glucosidase n=1 Tax=Hanseniaspora guilliermondii TaxID=56406 RepID=A0A1L0CS53_9ASCO|nr:related to Cell wall protein YJL171C [Hanseniaspora guilliermondii]
MIFTNQLLFAFGLFISLAINADASFANQVDQLWFSNVGFNGYYDIVEHVAGNEKCECYIMDDHHYFEGSNAPLNEPLSVHFRGPLSLHKFAFYTSDAFYADSGSSSQSSTIVQQSTQLSAPTNNQQKIKRSSKDSSSWSRVAYYDHSDSSSASNVTFMNREGDKSKCLGNAISYADSTGLKKADSATILEKDNYIASDEEFIIFSNVSCPNSSVYDTCGVYREGIPAYEGFYGDVKMFLFEFEAPTESQSNSSSFESYDMPAIWVLNSKIPRQSQYPTNSNCSCWASGCGEFDIFEVINGSTNGEFYSTFHTFQGVDSVSVGLSQSAYFKRDTNGTMTGGVIFDSDGNTVSFMSDSLTFDESISASDMLKIIQGNEDDESSTTLSSVSVTYTATSITGTTSSFKNEVAILINNKLSALASFFIVLFNIL